MDSLASCTWRNVCKEGFQLEGVADAGEYSRPSNPSRTTSHTASSVLSTVFLDLPAPWEAIESAKASLKVGRPFSTILTSCRLIADRYPSRSAPSPTSSRGFAASHPALSKSSAR